ncbi:acyl-CoA dehydrogenase family protein [Elioraea sp.]|uniref:acyl-CoA dehydrogenase family protein n=1 Tax=Elioraea sp. TaxID=2185103 RepID=UPI0021DE1089|nr:acyl-CoA dehydrogenase [Elioraea sp.]GIX11963.1 MAG: pimeloyl-CoA dehydrogenase small subunit [Elioraea sp.]
MDFDLSEDQRLLRDSLTRLLGDRYGFEARKGYAREPEGWSRAMWAAYAELGLLGLPFAEADGGYGGGAVETMLVAEALGEALTLEPWLATVVLGGGFLRHGARAERRAALVPAIARGSLLLAFASTEAQSRWDLHDVATTAKRDGDEWVLEGRKLVVLHGDVADRLVVTARTGGDRRDRAGIGVFLTDAKAPGLTRRGHRTNDGRRAAEVTLAGVRVAAEDVLGDPGDGLPLIERVVDEAIAALAAEAVGVMVAAQKLTLDYLKMRKQFGVPIGSFQVLQHKAADVMMAIEQSRSMAMYAAMSLEETDPVERGRAMSAVKAQIGRAAKFVAEETVQMHGGIGITMEYAVAHCMARLGAIEAMFGNAEFHLRRLAERGGLIAA